MPLSWELALTVTLKPKMFSKEPEKQYDETATPLLLKLADKMEELLIIAECTKSMNVHYHLMCRMKLKEGQYATKELHKLFRNDIMFGFINVKPVTDIPGWLEYIKKDLDITKGMLNRRPIVIDTVDHLKDLHAEYANQW